MSSKQPVVVVNPSSPAPAVDPADGVELLARSIARSGGRVVAVSIGGVARPWPATRPCGTTRAAGTPDADAVAVRTGSKP